MGDYDRMLFDLLFDPQQVDVQRVHNALENLLDDLGATY